MWAHDQMSFSAYYADALCMKIFKEKYSTHIKSSPPLALIPSTPLPFLSLLRIQNNILLGYRAGCYQINMASLNKKCFKRSAIMHLPSGAPAWPPGPRSFPIGCRLAADNAGLRLVEPLGGGAASQCGIQTNWLLC